MGRVVGEPRLEKSRKAKKGQRCNYYIFWTDSIEGSKELSTRTDVYADALRFFDKWRLRNLGMPTPRSIEEVTVREVLDFYRRVQVSKKKSVERSDFASLRLNGFWGDRPVSIINSQTQHDYEAYRFNLHEQCFPNKEPLSENTVRRELVVLRAALHRAYRAKFFDQEVFIELPTEKMNDVSYFSCREAMGLIYFSKRMPRAKQYLPIFLAIGFLTGRRKTAILELRWGDINFDGGFIVWQLEGAVKTNKKRPKGALPPRLRQILLKHRVHYPDDEYVVSYNGVPMKDIKKSFGDVVNDYRAHIFRTSSSDTKRVLTKAYPHMMRHSCATWLMQKGADKRESCQFLGMTEDTLERRYWHHHPDFQRGPANMF